MARVLTFDELAALPTGTHVWEDCMWLTAPAEMVKLRTDNQRGRKRVFGCYSGEKGELLAFGSARPRTEERFDAGSHTTYFGYAQAVVRLGASGSATLKVRDRYTEELTSLAL